MKQLLIICGFLFTTLATFSQQKADVKFNAGMETFMPTGNLNNTHHFGLGGNLEMEVKSKESSFSFITITGYDYILGRDANQSFVQIPASIGARLRFDSTWSISQTAGVSFFNEAIGFKPTYTSSLRFDVGKICIDVKYTTSVISGHKNDISGFGIRLAYKLN